MHSVETQMPGDETVILDEGQTTDHGEAPAPYLEVIAGGDRGATFPIRGGETSVGRNADNGALLSDASVSRHHFALSRGGGRVRLRDLGSGNGTRVNGQRVEEVELYDGDEIAAGTTRLRFVVPPDLAAAPGPKGPPSRPEVAGAPPAPSLLGRPDFNRLALVAVATFTFVLVLALLLHGRRSQAPSQDAAFFAGQPPRAESPTAATSPAPAEPSRRVPRSRGGASVDEPRMASGEPAPQVSSLAGPEGHYRNRNFTRAAEALEAAAESAYGKPAAELRGTAARVREVGELVASADAAMAKNPSAAVTDLERALAVDRFVKVGRGRGGTHAQFLRSQIARAAKAWAFSAYAARRYDEARRAIDKAIANGASEESLSTLLRGLEARGGAR